MIDPSPFALRDSLEDKFLAISNSDVSHESLMQDVDRLLLATQADAQREVLRMVLRHYFFLLTGYLPETIPTPIVGQYRSCVHGFTNAMNAIESIYALSPKLFPPPSETSHASPSSDGSG